MNYYEIRRALKPGVNLTVAQRSSSLFAEEPVVMGVTLRRGLPPMKITEEQFERNKVSLVRLESAGAIEITKLFSSVPVKSDVPEGSSEPQKPAETAPVETAPINPPSQEESKVETVHVESKPEAPVADPIKVEEKVEVSAPVADAPKSKKKSKE